MNAHIEAWRKSRKKPAGSVHSKKKQDRFIPKKKQDRFIPKSSPEAMALKTKIFAVSVVPRESIVAKGRDKGMQDDQSLGTVITAHPFGRWGMIIIALQALWALFIPIKNVVAIPFPAVDADGVSVVGVEYVGMNGANDSLPSFKGSEIVQIMKRMLEITLGNTEYYQKLRTAGGLYPDILLDFATAEEFAVISQYISLVHQKAKFPSGRFLVRDERVIFKNDSDSNFTRTFRCLNKDQYLPGTICRNSHGEPCVGWSMEDHVMLQHVDIASPPFPTTGSGWQNSVALSALIGGFHDALRGVIKTRDWGLTYRDMLHPVPYIPSFAEDGTVYVHDFWLPNLAMSTIGTNSVIKSCAATEMIYTSAYVLEYALSLVDSYLRANRLFKADVVIFKSHSVVESRMAQVLHDNYTITSGVKLLSNSTKMSTLFGYTLTTLIESSASIKPFRPMDGPLIMGNSASMVRRLVEASFLGWVNNTEGATEDTSIVSLGGSIHAGLQMFKDEWTTQSASVLKLRERTLAEGTGLDYNLFDRYEAYEDWYMNFDQASSLSLSTFAKPYLGNDTGEWAYLCRSAFVGSMARVVWVGIVNSYAFATFQHYQWKLSSGSPKDWYDQHLDHVLQMVGENSAGLRAGVPYELDSAFEGRYGAAWPIFPLLATLRLNYTQQDIFDRIMSTVNNSWIATQGSYQGRALYFDASSCFVGLDTPDKSTPDTKVFYNSLYPAVAATIKRMIEVAPQISDMMDREVAPLFIHPNAFTGTTTYSDSMWLDTSAGAPFYWRHNALQLGLTKFIGFQLPKRNVFRSMMEPILVCFDTVELRYLNNSVRCYSEYGAQTIKRVEKISTLLKTMLTTNWAHGVVLNLMGTYAAMRFLHNLWRVFKCNQFRDVNWDIALNMFILGPDTISLSELVVLAASNIPLLVGYHLPTNLDFIKAQDQPNYWVGQVIVAVSLTWYIRLGVECGRRCIFLRYSNIWYDTAMSRAQYLLLTIVFVARLSVSEVNGNYDQGIWVLIFSILLSFILGFLLIVSSKFVDHQPDTMSIMDTRLLENNIPRNWVGGRLAQSSEGWHVSGMIFENWYIGGDLLWFGPQQAIRITDDLKPYLAHLPKVGGRCVHVERPT